jgi:hypothetical protein
MEEKIMCACTKTACAGECRKEHLHRKRQHLDRCPSAYTEKPKRERRERDDDEDYYDN